jgi:hypothetical protein
MPTTDGYKVESGEGSLASISPSVVGAKLVLVGEAPSAATAWRAGAAPLVGETGRRLALWSSLSAADFRRATVCVNLFDDLPQRWTQREARARAEWLWSNMTQSKDVMWARYGAWHVELCGATSVLLLGARVARAFGFVHLPPYVWHVTAGPRLATMPHPSGHNLYWNDKGNVNKASAFLRAALGVEHVEPTQGHLLEAV